MLRDLLQNGDILQIFETFLALALIVASLLCLVFIIWGGIRFILSAGNEDTIKKAIHTIRYAIIGLLVTFIAFFVVSWIARLLGIPFQLDFGQILQLMQDIFASLKQ
jgi:ABC-type Fe3+ transport system permease subunit